MKQREEKLRLPIDAFCVCPSCKTDNGLRNIGVDVLCFECGWDSSNIFVESGLFDQWIYEYEERLARQEIKKKVDKHKRALRECALHAKKIAV
jgi:hypothetical protein